MNKKNTTPDSHFLLFFGGFSVYFLNTRRIYNSTAEHPLRSQSPRLLVTSLACGYAWSTTQRPVYPEEHRRLYLEWEERCAPSLQLLLVSKSSLVSVSSCRWYSLRLTGSRDLSGVGYAGRYHETCSGVRWDILRWAVVWGPST